MPKNIPAAEWSDGQVLEEARALRVAYKLKRTLRYNTERDLTVHNESVAEHMFALFFLSEYFLPFEDPEATLDYKTIQNMILYHDFPEIKHGDIPYALKTSEDEERERVAATEVFASLPSSMRETAKETWEAFERRDTPEARFVNALDKVEPLFELFDPVNEKTPMRLKQPYESHIGKKLTATEDYPFMRRFVDVLSGDMARRGIFWKEQ